MKRFMFLAIVAMFATISTANASINREDPPKKIEWEVSDQCRETNVNYSASQSNAYEVSIKRSDNEGYKATVHREDGSVSQWNSSDEHSNNFKSNAKSGEKVTKIKVDCWANEKDDEKDEE